MKKISCWLFLFIALPFLARADHITGGEMFYELVNTSGGMYQYEVTLKLYMRCNSGRQFNNPTIVSVFNKATGARVMDLNVNLSGQTNISLPSNSNPCITNPPNVCFDVGLYKFSVTVPPSAEGYILSSQVNYRISGINNLSPGYGFIGATYTAEIPGTQPIPSGPSNHSAHFTGSDLVMVCADNPFTYSFAASDGDGDELKYHFCGAYVSGSAGMVAAPPSPPYNYVPYGPNFSDDSPLGAEVQVDENTGLITGTAPSTGVYVVTVCVQEIRNGVVIATQRKDIQIFIAPCTIAAAVLDPQYLLCRDTRTISVTNGSESPLIHTYNWTASDQAGNLLGESSNKIFNYTFSDTGLYRLRLWINANEQCSDSAASLVRVYPGLVPGMTSSGICFTKPTQFRDASTSAYGTVNSWRWDFGETTVTNDQSVVRNPVYTYPSIGTKNVSLVITDTKGCKDTTVVPVSIVEKPPMTLKFRDTLICVNDVVQLQAAGDGVFNWTGPLNYTANGPTASVSPFATSIYVVNLDDNGCLNKDSVSVRVVDKVTLSVMKDTVICEQDTVNMRVSSDALRYSWSPAVQFIDPLVGNAVCFTPATTTYALTATIGGCHATKTVTISTVPFPIAFAGADTTICYSTQAFLHGSSNGIRYSWSPGNTLSNASGLTTTATPQRTTAYVLSAFNNLGCPKPGRDTVLVTVRPRIAAFAGNDTAVIVNQPLQFQATGGVRYVWYPSNFLSSSVIANPVGNFSGESDSLRYQVIVYDEADCADTATMLVKIYRTIPTIFVPTAFTPNHDGRNEELRPIAVGMQKIISFHVYNRWGQLVFSGTANGKGWDGRVNGREQATDTYIWVVKATDFKGSPYQQKGYSTLIR